MSRIKTIAQLGIIGVVALLAFGAAGPSRMSAAHAEATYGACNQLLALLGDCSDFSEYCNNAKYINDCCQGGGDTDSCMHDTSNQPCGNHINCQNGQGGTYTNSTDSCD